MTGRTLAASHAGSTATLSDYLALTKPRVVLMIMVTAAAGFYLASPAGARTLDYFLLARTLMPGTLLPHKCTRVRSLPITNFLQAGETGTRFSFPAIVGNLTTCQKLLTRRNRRSTAGSPPTNRDRRI